VPSKELYWTAVYVRKRSPAVKTYGILILLNALEQVH
jgi:hypothetical protein